MATKKAPRQSRLPTLDDPAIEELESAAEEYAEIRDSRMKLTEREVELRERVLDTMKRHKKSVYEHDGVHIERVPGEERVKVRIKKPKEEEPEN